MNRGDVADLAGSVGAGALTAFAVLAAAVSGVHGDPLFTDEDLHAWPADHRPAVGLALARGLTATGTGAVPYALAVLAGLVAARTARGRLVTVALCAGCLAGGQAARYGVMDLVARPRPPRPDWAARASGWAFPSGHATTATLAAGLLAIAVCVRAPRGRAAFVLAACCWAASVGLSRVYLGMHWFTDVIGGWLFGVGWLGLWLAAAARWLPREATNGPRATPGTPGSTGTTGTPGTTGSIGTGRGCEPPRTADR